MSMEVGKNLNGREKFRQPRADMNIDFRSKLKHESELSSGQIRSDLFAVQARPYAYDVWRLQPPNFNPQAFEPDPSKTKEDLVDVLKAECKTMAEISKLTPNADERRRNDKRIRDLFVTLRELDAERQRAKAGYSRPATERPSFRLRFRPSDRLKAKVEFTKHGTHKKEAYVSPQPHDYRQYPRLKTLGLPEFTTKYETDCFGLKCKTEGLSIMQGPPADVLREVPVRSRSEYALPRHPAWDEKLMLPKLPFPNKYAAYSRHRRKDRSARSAFLERAEDMMMKRSKEIDDFRNSHQSQTVPSF